jgi:hypothetical protein
MYKGILILAITGLLLVLGTNYLFVYSMQQKTIRERDRQDKVYWRAFTEIEHFGEHPEELTEHNAKIALEEARNAGMNKNREGVLQNYFQDLERCYQGERESCKRANSDMSEAISDNYGRVVKTTH